MNSIAKICLQKIRAYKRIAPFLQGRMKQHFHNYHRNEDGVMSMLSLYFFLIFMIMAGLGLGVMRHEMNRAKLSVTLDAAVLAGAGAEAGSTVADIKAIVEDYFSKNGMAGNLNAIDTDGVGQDDIVTSLNATRVFASAQMTINTYLLRLVGVNTLKAHTAGEAQIATPKLEVSLVLDVSGSMRGDKLAALKTAAKEFVTTILDSGNPGDISISIIPFSFGVTPPVTIFNALSVDQKHGNSNCIVFLENEFSTTAVDPNTTYAQQIYTSRYGNNFGGLSSSWRSCYTDAYFKILPYSMSESELHAKIDSLQADGNTSGHLGIKWGAALLDPAFKPVSAALITAGEVNSNLSNIPANWGEPETLKVIVMMGDGANTNSYYFNDPNDLLDPSVAETHVSFDYRGPNSDLWEVKYDNFTKTAYFLHNPNDDRYRDINDVVPGGWLDESEFNNLSSLLPTMDQVAQLSWEDAWGHMSPRYYQNETGISTAFNDYSYQERVTGSMKNTRMRSICTATKNQGVVIYTIGFEVPVNGTAETELRDCAQSPSNYFPVDDVNISSAFSAIASNVQNLRLTQ
jgi:hypothetical protein